MGGPWTAADVPSQRGRVAFVTGANSGIGFETAKVLAERAARVVLACRDIGKAKAAAQRIRTAVPNGDLAVLRLDLASLASIREAADEFHGMYDTLDLLVNNAGVMRASQGLTEDGFELHFGINHLGHFALTLRLLDLMRSAPGSRIVTVSSLAHQGGVAGFDDHQFERTPYDRARAYARSKLANLLFTFELQRRLAASDAQTAALAAHPGGVSTNLTRHMPLVGRLAAQVILRAVGQSSALWGALPILRAATDPGAQGGEYYGPDGRSEFKGHPTRVTSTPLSRDIETQRRLWDESIRLTGVACSI
jgi:NAD(P)-dependent dehydrogenase (short-subunit alcohol dehydrogenase family)